MPIYEYRCKSCGQRVEIIQKVGERSRRKCEECGGRLEKLISRTAFLLKGGGWYSEGYSSSGGAKSDKGETKSEKKKKDPASAGTSESKTGGDSKNGGDKRSASAG